MSKYKMTLSKTGSYRYYCDGVAIVKDRVPAAALKYLMRPGMVYDESKPPEIGGGVGYHKLCIFCGAQGLKTRFVNGQIVYLCDDHYPTSRIGVIAAKLRELSSDQLVDEDTTDKEMDEIPV